METPTLDVTTTTDATAAQVRQRLLELLLPELNHDINSPFSVVESTYSSVLSTLALLKERQGDSNLTSGEGEDERLGDDLAFMLDHLPQLVAGARQRAWDVKMTAEAMLAFMQDPNAERDLDEIYSLTRHLLRGYLKHRVQLEDVPVGKDLHPAVRNTFLVLTNVLVRAGQGALPGTAMTINWHVEPDEAVAEIECHGAFDQAEVDSMLPLAYATETLLVSGGKLEQHESGDRRYYAVRIPLEEGCP